MSWKVEPSIQVLTFSVIRLLYSVIELSAVLDGRRSGQHLLDVLDVVRARERDARVESPVDFQTGVKVIVGIQAQAGVG